MLRCLGTNKYIPKRYIMDGIPDCYGNFDESIAADSCALNDRHRFACRSENKCLLTILLDDATIQCFGKEDEAKQNMKVTHVQELLFSAICNGRTDFIFSTNDTDETNCDEWMCSNQYTRCDGVWNCPNGIDEINCSTTLYCPKDHHRCIFPKSKTMGCLHINRTDDGIVDCLGATDERRFCRQWYPDDEDMRYRCWNDSKCVRHTSRCHKCKQLEDIDELCSDNEYDQDQLSNHFDSLNDLLLAKKKMFTPLTSDLYPKAQSADVVKQQIGIQKTVETEHLEHDFQLQSRLIWFCNRGILIISAMKESERCLCPPAYYGNRCQYQSQRVSLTLRFINEYFDKFAVIDVVITLVDNTGYIHSVEKLTYIPVLDCNTKYNIYLLYRDRPKDMTKNYTVHIDAYNKVNLFYLSSWTLPITFLFMPVNRISAQLKIPARHISDRMCNAKYTASKSILGASCLNDSHNFEYISADKKTCDCSPGSLCVGMLKSQSICICPLTKVSPRCILDSICTENVCMNGGVCVPREDRFSLIEFRCICQDGYFGQICQHKDVQIDISFSGISIPDSILAHFFTIAGQTFYTINQLPIRVTMFKKIGFDQVIATFYKSSPFHLVFAQIQNDYYLAVVQHNFTPSILISTEIAPSQYCPHISHFFNESMIQYPILRRVKYYHRPCMTHPHLSCFHDSEVFMCLCTKEHHANCFHFDFNTTYDCAGVNRCQNGALCFQDNPTCPTKVMCVCQECFYGTRCQFTTKQFGLSLDALLGYQIYSHVSISRQPMYVKISIATAAIMLSIDLIFGTLAILTFQSKACRKAGSGIYILASSIASVLTMVHLNFKLWFLILSQMSLFTSRRFLLFSCISNEFMLRILLAITDWYHAAVAIERVTTVIVGVKFYLMLSKRIAKLLVFLIPLFTSLSFLHDPIHRRLIDDEEEKRTWCVIDLTSEMQFYNSIINIFHFITPFVLKVISAIGIVIFIAKNRSKFNKNKSYQRNLIEQLYMHKNLIISSSVLVLLAVPRIVLAFSSGCMKSARTPTLYLIGYFISFIPSLLTFFVFVPTSRAYKKELMTVLSRKWRSILSLLRHY